MAYFGTGDQIGYTDNCQDAMGILEERISELGGQTIGYWLKDGYDFEDYRAVKEGQCVGLALNEDNQEDLTEQPEIDWSAHYYALRAQLPCDRIAILAQMVRYLFGEQNYRTTKGLIEVLEKELLHSLWPHSLYRRDRVTPGGIEVPLLV